MLIGLHKKNKNKKKIKKYEEGNCRLSVVYGLPVTSPPGRLATSEIATKERSHHQRTRHQAKPSRHQPPMKR